VRNGVVYIRGVSSKYKIEQKKNGAMKYKRTSNKNPTTPLGKKNNKMISF
jgi:hypothetical protein